MPPGPPNEDDGPPADTGVDATPIDLAKARAAIKPRLDAMALAVNAHMQAAEDESVKSKAIHALTRHGFQTGWMGQLFRICTKLTPDQEYDPLGVNPIAEKLVDQYEFRAIHLPMKKYKNRKGGGVAAGMFYNPEIQRELIERSIQIAVTEAQAYPECEVVNSAGMKAWFTYNFIHVYTIKQGGAGVAFAKDSGWVKLNENVVSDAIDKFMRGTPLPGQTRPEFATWGDLLGFLKVKQIRRNGARTEITLKKGTPTIMTMMPESVDPSDTGFAPTSIDVPKSQRNDFKTWKWTGGLRNTTTRVTRHRLPPSWAR